MEAAMQKLIILLIVLLTAPALDAAQFRDQSWHADRGVLESIRLEPRLPEPDEAFAVLLQGSWPEKDPNGTCRPPLTVDGIEVHPGNRVQAISNLPGDTGDCEEPAAQWNIRVEVPAEAWSAVDVNGFLLFEHLLFSGINMLTGINQIFDLRLGTHEVPADLGSGFWISEERPYEGLMVEQQGQRVLFYSLSYDRDFSEGDQGEPVWQLVSGEMYGNSVLGRSYRYDWPEALGYPPVAPPEHDDLFTVNDSGSIVVEGFNHIRAFTSIGEGNVASYDDYRRMYFGLGPGLLPVYAPPLDGRWTVHGFEGRNATFLDNVELLQGRISNENSYEFQSVEGDWAASCTITPPGDGSCRLERASDGVVMEFDMSDFQGNMARGPLHTGQDDPLTGVLVREPWRLPGSPGSD